MSARLLTLCTVLALTVVASAADLAKVPRTLVKEPAYSTKSPRYLLLTFGLDATHHVWLVQDGDTLYVDRNGNGDLTDHGESVVTKKRPGSNPEEDGRSFEAGDLTAGGVTHKALVVNLLPLTSLGESVRTLPDASARLRADPKAQVAFMTLEVRNAQLKGPGVEGRLPVMVGPLDLDGLLVFAAKPDEAPIVHPDGPLAITFFSGRPTFQIGRDTDAILVVGSPGLGRGTLTMLQYDQVIPDNVHPTLEIAYPAKESDAPFRERFELKQRC